jgi:hypothetical protein
MPENPRQAVDFEHHHQTDNLIVQRLTHARRVDSTSERCRFSRSCVAMRVCASRPKPVLIP